ncbi:MAG TPA: CAP domain-containing protein [Micromonosporaceae bacterium]
MAWPERSPTPAPANRGSRWGRFAVRTGALMLLLSLAGLLIAPRLAGSATPAGSGAALRDSPAATPQNTPPSPGLRTEPPAAGRSARATMTAKPEPTTARPVPTAATVSGEVLRLTNLERASAGCRPLRADAELDLAARRHTEEMARYQYMSHTGRDGSDPGDRMRAAGYDTGAGWAENVARGFSSAQAVVAGWMRSDGHRANILNCRYVALGVGVARSSTGELFWTQDFGAS